jgi:hypothetical protein
MTHIARESEELWLHSMGKRFRVRAITTTDDEANGFMERNRDCALIACFGPFNVIANTYAGVRDETFADRRARDRDAS